MRAALVAVLGLLAIAATAVAATQGTRGLHDARYCEIIEIKGTPPTATAVVWNTIGLGDCPAAQWDAIDAAALAKEQGDTAVVKNGPRHFLMDAGSAETGEVREFGGMRMTQLASIPIRSTEVLAQTPYTDRTIKRSNTFTWNRGRTVFELVAPGGDVYVMQSYAQIRDPALTIDDLPALGKRLTPPDGWRYRTRRLSRELVLVARGRATVIQDDLLDTYQLAHTTRAPGRRVRRHVSLAGKAGGISTEEGVIEARDTLHGAPFGRGRLVLNGQVQDDRLNGTFRMLFRRGSISGTVALPFTLSDGELDVLGPVTVTGGTGAYRGITSTRLVVHDHRKLDGNTGTITVRGFVTY